LILSAGFFYMLCKFTVMTEVQAIRPRRKRDKDSTCRHVAENTSVVFNPLECRGNYIATSNNMKLVHWPLMGGLLHLVQRGGDWAGPRPLLAVPNVTAHPSTASVPTTILLYNGPLLCGFNVPFKGFTRD